MLVEIQFDKSSFELRSNVVQSNCTVGFNMWNNKVPDIGSKMTKGFLASGGSFELYINVI